jgi:serine/threonine protein kinase
MKWVSKQRGFWDSCIARNPVSTHYWLQDPEDRHNNVRMTHHFYFRNHLCIAFECLSLNLYEFIKSNEFKGFSIGLIRRYYFQPVYKASHSSCWSSCNCRFSIQLLNSLSLLYKYKVVHCDLKPEVNTISFIGMDASLFSC